jgi:pyrroloquinoline quinone (PQQ) biosynthesis protein C
MNQVNKVITGEDLRKNLEKMVNNISKHLAVNNDFYKLWMAGPINIEGLEVFVRNYGAFVKYFPNAMTSIILVTDDLEAKTEYVKTLFSEMGYGNPTKLHSLLFDAFFSRLADKLGYRGRLDRSRLEKQMEILPTTRKFIDGERWLYGNTNPRIAAGAQLAQEWQAYTMLRQLYEGARNYAFLWSNQDEFHEDCEYYYVHIGAAEKDHKEESINAAIKCQVDESSLEDISFGFNEHLALYVDFWKGIHDEIVRKQV